MASAIEKARENYKKTRADERAKKLREEELKRKKAPYTGASKGASASAKKTKTEVSKNKETAATPKRKSISVDPKKQSDFQQYLQRSMDGGGASSRIEYEGGGLSGISGKAAVERLQREAERQKKTNEKSHFQQYLQARQDAGGVSSRTMPTTVDRGRERDAYKMYMDAYEKDKQRGMAAQYAARGKTINNAVDHAEEDKVLEKIKLAENLAMLNPFMSAGARALGASFGAAKQIASSLRPGVGEARSHSVQQMTPDETETYRYVVGKYGVKAGNDYLEAIDRDLNRRREEKLAPVYEEFGKEHPVLGTAVSVGEGVIGGMEGIAATAKNMLSRETLDPNDPIFSTMNMGNAVRRGIRQAAVENEPFKREFTEEELAYMNRAEGEPEDERMEAAIEQKKQYNALFEGGAGLLVDVGLSAAGSLTSALTMGPAAILTMGGNAGGNALRDAIENGATNEQATMQALAQGGAEAIFEKISLGGFAALKQLPVTNLKALVKNFVKQSATEASEEMATELSNIITDRIIMGDQSEWMQEYEARIASGEDERAALFGALMTSAQRVGMAGLAGALSGGVTAGVGSAIGTYGQGLAARKTFENGQEAAGSGYQELAESIDDSTVEGVAVKTMGQAYADRVRSGGKIGTMENAYLENAVNAAMEKSMQEQDGAAADDVTKELEETGTNERVIEPISENSGTNGAEIGKVPENIGTEVVEYGTQEARTAKQTPALSENQLKGIEEVNRDFGIMPSEEQQARIHSAIMSKDPIVRQSSMIDELSKGYSVNGRQAIKESYDPTKADAPEFFRAFNRVYTAARYGSNEMDAAGMAQAALLDDKQFTAAFRAGYQDRQDAVAAARRVSYTLPSGIKRKNGGAIVETSLATKEMQKVADTIAKKTGLTIRLVDNELSGAFGSYNQRVGTISVDVTSNNYLQTLTHELTHYIKDYAPESFEFYTDTVIQAIQTKPEFAALKERYENAYKEVDDEISEADIIEEIVADATGAFLNDAEFAQEIVKKDRSLGQSILDFIESMIDALKSLVSDVGLSKVSSMLKEDLRAYEDARDIWMASLDEAGENFAKGNPTRESSKEKYQAMLHPEAITQENLEKNVSIVQEMKPVAIITKDEFSPFENRKELVEKIYRKIGGEYRHPDVGIVNVNKTAIKDDIGHKYRREKIWSFSALPEMIKKGHVVYYDRNHKGRAYDTAVLASKIRIDVQGREGTYYALAIVIVNPDTNRVHLHDVEIEKENPSAFLPSSGYVPLIGNGLPAAEDSLSIISIFDMLNSVNAFEEKKQLNMEKDAEDGKSLIAVHNLPADKLKKTMTLEGIPMPSIAVTKADMGWDKFGEISLVFRKDTIDPKKRKNKVYAADAWTPTVPRTEYDANMDIAYDAMKYIEDMSERVSYEGFASAAKRYVSGLDDRLDRIGGEEELIQDALGNDGMKAAYLASIGEDIAVRENEIREELPEMTKKGLDAIVQEFGDELDGLEKVPVKEYAGRMMQAYARGLREAGISEEEVTKRTEKISALRISSLLRRAKEYRENGGIKVRKEVDEAPMRTELDEKVREAGGMEDWVRDLFGGIERASGIWNGKELYTASGNRRSFDKLHYPVTAENLVKAMLAQSEDVRNVAGFNGIKSIRAVAADEFDSISDIHAAEDRLKNIDEEQYKEKAAELQGRLDKVIGEIASRKGTYNSMIAMDEVGYVVLEVSEGRSTAEDVKNKLLEYRWQCTDEEAAEIADIIREVREMPVNMFEAKPQRVVGYDEIAYAVVPNDADAALVEQLEERGVAVVFYKAGDAENRLRAVQALEGIRFQLDIDQQPAADLAEENKQLKKANSELTKILNIYRDNTPSKRDVDRVAAEMIRKYNSKADKKMISEQIGKLYEYMRSAEHIDGKEVSEVSAAIAKEVISQASYADDAEQAIYGQLKSYLRGQSIFIPEAYRDDINGASGYNEWRKRYFGRINFTTDPQKGVAVDSVYEELQGLFPGLLDTNALNPADQAVAIAHALDHTKPVEKALFIGADADEQAYLLSQDIMDAYFSVGSENAKTQYEKTYKRNMKQMEREILLEYQREIDAMRGAYKDYKAKQREAAGRRWQKKRDRYEDSRKRQQYKKDIIKDTKKLGKMLVQPTDKLHVPMQLAADMADMLSYIDFSSAKDNVNGEPTKRTVEAKRFRTSVAMVQRSLQNIADAEGVYTLEDGSSMYVEMDPDIIKSLSEIDKKVEALAKSEEHISIEELETYELETLRNVLISARHLVEDANRFLSNERYKTIEDGANATFSELSGRKNKNRVVALEGLDKLFQLEMLDSQSFFHRVGDAGTSFYKALRKGFDQKVRNARTAEQYMLNIVKQHGVTQKEMRKWAEEAKEYTVGGKKIYMTVAQIMSLYELDKRGQARKHLYSEKGGMKAEPVKIKGKKKLKKYSDEILVRVREEDVKRLTDTLSSSQKAVADAIGRFFTVETARWGNEVSMQLYGYKKFNAKDYFPIRVDRNQLATTTQAIENNVTALKNMGSTKATNDQANNPIIIENIFSVYNRQADTMGSYNAFVVPLADLQKWFNYKNTEVSIKNELTRVLGKDALKYITNLMVDINGTGTKTKLLTAKWQRNFKAASVGANLRTAIQQPTSYVRALAVMDMKYLLKGLALRPGKTAKKEWELCKKYAPIAQWKDWGFFDINTGRSMESILLGSSGIKEDIVEKSMWLASMGDTITWTRLWYASQAQVKDQNPELEVGNEAFYNKAGEVFSDVIDKTQVVDSVFHRSAMMKNKDGLIQLYTAFMSEPTKTYNMLYRAAYDVVLGKPGAKKRLAGAVGVFAMSAISTALAASLISAMRDEDREKEFGEKYIDAFTDDVIGNINPLNMIPVVKDVVSIFQGYDLNRTDMQVFEEAERMLNYIKKFREEDSPYTLPGLISQSAKLISTATGIPVKNAMRDAGAVVNTLIDAMTPVDINIQADYLQDKMFYNMQYTKNQKRFLQSILRALAAGDEELARKLADDMIKNGMDEDDMEKKIKDMLGDEPEAETAVEALKNDDMDAVEENKKILEAKGYPRSYIDEKVESMFKNNPPYEYSAIRVAVVNKSEDMKKILDEFFAFKKKTGMDEDEVISNIKRNITSYYKPEYLEGDAKKKNEIRSILYGIMIRGHKLYEKEDIDKWEE